MDATTLERYVGKYSLGSTRILTITRDGTQLNAQITGQPTLPIDEQTPSKFVWRAVEAHVAFTLGDSGRAASATIHQGGQDIVAQRLEEADAQALERQLADRIAQQRPQKGSEQALRKALAAADAGAPNYDDMTPSLQAVVRRQLPAIAATATERGAIQSVEFKGVSKSGADQYVVTYASGKQLQCLIQLNENDKITTLALMPRF